MTARDRLVVIGLGVLAVLAAVFLLLVAPERKQASSLVGQLATERAQLASAEGAAASARAAEAQYPAAYASIVGLGKAVPPSREEPALLYQLAQATNQKNVEFEAVTSTAAGAGGSGAATAAFTAIPLTFVFNGSFSNLQHLFESVDGYVVSQNAGNLLVSGRLLTIQSVSLAPTVGAQRKGGAHGAQLTGTITASAYVLPLAQGLTAGATAATPAGSAPAAAAATPSSPAAPAVVRVAP